MRKKYLLLFLGCCLISLGCLFVSNDCARADNSGFNITMKGEIVNSENSNTEKKNIDDKGQEDVEKKVQDKIKINAKTGDESNIGFWVILLIFAFTIMSLCVFLLIRHRKKRKYLS